MTLSIVGTNDLHGAVDRLPILAGYVLGAELIEASVIAEDPLHIDYQLAMLQNYRPTILITTPTNALDLMRMIGIEIPVGLFGFVRKTALVDGVIAASTSSSANSKSGRGPLSRRRYAYSGPPWH